MLNHEQWRHAYLHTYIGTNQSTVEKYVNKNSEKLLLIDGERGNEFAYVAIGLGIRSGNIYVHKSTVKVYINQAIDKVGGFCGKDGEWKEEYSDN